MKKRLPRSPRRIVRRRMTASAETLHDGAWRQKDLHIASTVTINRTRTFLLLRDRMKMETQDALSSTVLIILVLVGVLLAFPAVFAGQTNPQQIGLSVGLGIIVSATVALVRWAILPRTQKHTVIDGNKQIYQAFEKVLSAHHGDNE